MERASSPLVRGALALGALASLASALITTACAPGATRDAQDSSEVPSPLPTASTSSYMGADDLAFFEPTVLSGAALAAPPESIADAIDRSDLVLIAQVAGVTRTRTLIAETPNDLIMMLGIVLQPIETLHGDRGSDSPVVVEFIAGSDRDGAVAAMQSTLPPGSAVWFLREADIGDLHQVSTNASPPADGTYYNVVHLRGGLFVQGETHVVAGPWPGPPAEPAPPGELALPSPASLAGHGERFAVLDQLIAYIRRLD